MTTQYRNDSQQVKRQSSRGGTMILDYQEVARTALSSYLGARKSVALFARCSDAVVAGRATPLLQHPGFADIVELFQLAIDLP